MRPSPLLLLAPLLLACATHQPASGPPPTTTAPAPELANVAGIRIVHGLGGWGSGSAYNFEASRAGVASYDGGRRAVFGGRYEARIDTALVTMLVGEAVPLLDLPVTAMCADMEAHEVVVIYRDGKEKRLDAACRPPTEVLVLAQKIDSVFSMLSWTPVNTGH